MKNFILKLLFTPLLAGIEKIDYRPEGAINQIIVNGYFHQEGDTTPKCTNFLMGVIRLYISLKSVIDRYKSNKIYLRVFPEWGGEKIYCRIIVIGEVNNG